MGYAWGGFESPNHIDEHKIGEFGQFFMEIQTGSSSNTDFIISAPGSSATDSRIQWHGWMMSFSWTILALL